MSCHGNRCSHHLQQHLHATALIEPFERPNESGEGAGQDTDAPSSSKTTVQSRHIAVGVFDQRLDDASRHGNWSTILTCENTRHAHSAAYRKPTIALKVENDEKVAWKKRRPHGPQLAGVTNCSHYPGYQCPKALGMQVPLGLRLTLRLRMDEKP